MKEKKKQKTEIETGGGGDSIFDAVPATDNKMVSVSSGPYAEDLPVSGSTVGEVRQRFKDRFDIGDQAQAVLNGKQVGDETVLKTGENLAFIQHAGEKGGAKVVIEDGTASAGDKEMPLSELLPRLGPAISTSPVILPSGIKAILSQGSLTVWVWEKPPHIARLSWIRGDSPAPYGDGTTYRHVRIALPYLIILAVFARDRNGMPNIAKLDECFFRNEPLKSMNDELCYPALLNCSKHRDNVKDQAPLAWICTQYLKPTNKMSSNDPGDRYQAGFEAVRYCLLETSFNLSSEHHEGNSWYGASKKIDDRISPIENWEAATKKDPMFVLDVPWLKTGHSLAKVIERIFRIHGASGARIESADDVARIIRKGSQ